MQISKLIVAAGMSLTFVLAYSVAKSENAAASLWKIQKVLALKKYVDLTHEFARGIPRWPGFPDEKRKTIYWYDKRPDTLGAGFFSELFTRLHVFTRSCEEMGKGSRANPCWRVRRHADRLVEALAR